MFILAAARPLLFASALILATPAHALIELGFDDGEFRGYFTQVDHSSGVSFSVDPAGFASHGTGFSRLARSTCRVQRLKWTRGPC